MPFRTSRFLNDGLHFLFPVYNKVPRNTDEEDVPAYPAVACPGLRDGLEDVAGYLSLSLHSLNKPRCRPEYTHSHKSLLCDVEVDRLIGKADYLGPISSFHNNRKSFFWGADLPIKKKMFLGILFLYLYLTRQVS